MGGRGGRGYLKELSSTDLGADFRNTGEIGANDSFESLLCTRKGYRCHEGIKEGQACFLFSFPYLKTCRMSSLDLLLH